MEKFKKILSFLPFILSVCAGIYLTYLVDTITLDSFLQRAFVFLFFATSSSILFLLFKKYVGLDLSYRIILCAIALSISLVMLFEENFLPRQTRTVISFEAVIEENAGHPQEVWLSAVEIDGKNIPTSDLKVISNEKWTYRADLDDYVYYPVSNISAENVNRLTVEVFCENVKVVFARNSWSGKVAYTLDNTYEYTTLELYAGQDTSLTSYVLDLDLSAAGSPLARFFCFSGAIITISFFAYQLIVLMNKSFSKRKKKSAITKYFIENTLVFSIFLLLVDYLLDTLKETYKYTFEDITLDVGFIVLLLIYPYCSRIFPMLKKMKVLEILLLVFVSFVVAFQSVAQMIFMKLHNLTIGFSDILTFIIAMVVVAVPILEIALFVDKRTTKRFWGGEKIEKE